MTRAVSEKSETSDGRQGHKGRQGDACGAAEAQLRWQHRDAEDHPRRTGGPQSRGHRRQGYEHPRQRGSMGRDPGKHIPQLGQRAPARDGNAGELIAHTYIRAIPFRSPVAFSYVTLSNRLSLIDQARNNNYPINGSGPVNIHFVELSIEAGPENVEKIQIVFESGMCSWKS